MGYSIGVHHSVGELFPPTVLRNALNPSVKEGTQEIEQTSVDVQVVESADELTAYDGLVTFAYDEAFLTSGLQWIHSIQAGVDRFPFDELEKRDIHLTNSTGIHGDSVGETVLGYMLQFARRLHIHRDQEHRREWRYPDWDAAFTLPGHSLCVIGLGTLGQGIATRADLLGLDVVGVRRTPTPVEHVRRVYMPDEIEKAVAEARFVAVATPLTEATRGLIGAEELSAMRDDAYLLNVSRGGVVDETALLDALRKDDLAGAALDVFENEPLPENSPFWELENVIVTSHAAAANREYYQRVAALVRENIRRLATDEPLANQVL